MMDAEQVRGLYLVPPHGELIATGAKSAVVKSRYVPGDRLFDLRGDWMLVSKVDGVGLGLGDMTLGEPVEVSLSDFDTKEMEHRVERADRMRWWPESKVLWVYPIEGFKGYVKLLSVDVPAGVQTVMSSVVRQGVDVDSPIVTTDVADKAQPSRSRCMECKSSPVIDVHWADGRGRAWFCLKHFKEWIEDDDREIVRAFYLSDGEAPVKIGEGEQVLKLGERLTPKGLAVRVGSLIAEEGEKAYSSVAIALSIPLPVAKKLAVEGTPYEGGKGQGVIPADQLHLTLAFLGDAKELDERQALLQEGVAAFAAKNQVVPGEISGRIVFSTPNGSAVCAHFDSPELSDFRQRLVAFLDNLGFETKGDHGFTPHICLAYVEPGQEAGIETPTIPNVALGELSILWAGDRTDYQLKGTRVETKETDMQEITVLLDDEQLTGEKKYAKLSEANPSLRGIKPPITLAQANLIASYADAMEAAEDGPESPWGAAIAQFKDIYEKNEAGDGWVKREKPTESKNARGDYCICEKCAGVVEHKSDTPCNEIECGECDGMMRSATQAEIEAAGVQAGRAVTAAVMSGVDASVKEGANTAVFYGKEPPEHWASSTENTEMIKAEIDKKEGRRVRQDKVGLLQKLKEELNEFLVSLGKFIGWATYDDEPDKLDESEDGDSQEFDLGALIAATGKKAIAQGSTAFAFKALDGTTWWFQWTTNAFRDREGEIFTTKAIADFVDRKENDDIKGEFWFWHTPGTKFGNVRWQAMEGRFLAQAGPFDDTAVGQGFKEFFSAHPLSHPDIAPEGWGTSHGYSYKSTDRAVDGVYNWFDIRESTVLPGRFASNPYSPMPQILQEVTMNEQQRKALSLIGGDEFVQLVTGIGDESTKKLEGEVDFKEAAPDQDDKAGGNYVARIKEIAKGITDEGLKGQVEVFCAKLEEATPSAEKELDEAKSEKAKTDMAAMAGQLRMLAGKVGGDVGGKLTAIAEEMAKAYGKKGDAETTTKVEAEKAVEPEPEPEVNALTREEVAGAMKAIVEVLRDEIKESTKATVAEITEALKPLVDEVKSLKVADEVKVAEKAAETPAASLSSLLQSVIGSGVTRVDATSELAKSGPKETPPDANAVTGIPFVDAFIGGTDQASQKPTAGGS